MITDDDIKQAEQALTWAREQAANLMGLPIASPDLEHETSGNVARAQATLDRLLLQQREEQEALARRRPLEAAYDSAPVVKRLDAKRKALRLATEAAEAAQRALVVAAQEYNAAIAEEGAALDAAGLPLTEGAVVAGGPRAVITKRGRWHDVEPGVLLGWTTWRTAVSMLGGWNGLTMRLDRLTGVERIMARPDGLLAGLAPVEALPSPWTQLRQDNRPEAPLSPQGDRPVDPVTGFPR